MSRRIIRVCFWFTLGAFRARECPNLGAPVAKSDTHSNNRCTAAPYYTVADCLKGTMSILPWHAICMRLSMRMRRKVRETAESDSIVFPGHSGHYVRDGTIPGPRSRRGDNSVANLSPSGSVFARPMEGRAGNDATRGGVMPTGSHMTAPVSCVPTGLRRSIRGEHRDRSRRDTWGR